MDFSIILPAAGNVACLLRVIQGRNYYAWFMAGRFM
jgi:hypothetical protein